MIRYSQQDPKWKNKQLGTGDCTIGSDGCFLTCFAMLLDTEPDKVNDRIKTFGGFSGSLLSAWTVPNAYKQMYIDSQVFCPNNPAPLDTIDRAFEKGLAVIVQTDTKLDAGIQSHFVILTGKVGNDYGMVDPWPLVDEPPATLLGRYGKGRDAATVITYVLIIGGVENPSSDVNSTQNHTNIPPTPTTGLEIVPDALRGILEVGSDWCYLRSEPSTKGNDPICKIYRGRKLHSTGVVIDGDGHKWHEARVYVAEEYLK